MLNPTAHEINTVADCIRRSEEQGRHEEGSSEYGVTKSDARKLQAIDDWPVPFRGEVAFFDPEGPSITMCDFEEWETERSGSVSSAMRDRARRGVAVLTRDEEQEQEDILVWVSPRDYLTVESWLADVEDADTEVVFSLARFPESVGRIFVAHDEGIPGEAVLIGYGEAEEIREVEEEQVVVVLGGFTEFDDYRDYNTLISADAHRFKNWMWVDGDTIIESRFTRKAPHETLEVKLDTDVDFDEHPSGTAWSDEERDALFELIERYDSRATAVRIFAHLSNRSPEAAEYQYQQALRIPERAERYELEAR